jgi:hypothetical protein
MITYVGYILAAWLGSLAGFVAGAAWQARFPDDPDGRHYFGSDAYNAEADHWRDRADAAQDEARRWQDVNALNMAIVRDALGMDRECSMPEVLHRIHGLRGGRMARVGEFSRN